VSFHRTLRVPDDGKSYPLPPSFGRFPLYACSQYPRRLPAEWSDSASFFIALYQREALWLGFDAPSWHPSALVIGADGINAITGERWDNPLCSAPQNYLVVPEQPWLDGVRTRGGRVSQFIAMPKGEGYTLAEQLKHGGHPGIQLRAHEAKAGRFPDHPPALAADTPMRMRTPAPSLGIAAGGKIIQKIYPDSYGRNTWKTKGTTSAQIHIVNSTQFTSITGRPPPPSPISAADYTKLGLPWFELYDEEFRDIGAHPALKRVKSIGAVDAEKHLPREASVRVRKQQVKTIRRAGPGRSKR